MDRINLGFGFVTSRLAQAAVIGCSQARVIECAFPSTIAEVRVAPSTFGLLEIGDERKKQRITLACYPTAVSRRVSHFGRHRLNPQR